MHDALVRSEFLRSFVLRSPLLFYDGQLLICFFNFDEFLMGTLLFLIFMPVKN